MTAGGKGSAVPAECTAVMLFAQQPCDVEMRALPQQPVRYGC